MNEGKIIDRVRKLPNMSENATPKEGENALLLAQKLMVKYHLDESVFSLAKNEEKVVELASNLNSRKLVWTLLGL